MINIHVIGYLFNDTRLYFYLEDELVGEFTIDDILEKSVNIVGIFAIKSSMDDYQKVTVTVNGKYINSTFNIYARPSHIPYYAPFWEQDCCDKCGQLLPRGVEND